MKSWRYSWERAVRALQRVREAYTVAMTDGGKDATLTTRVKKCIIDAIGVNIAPSAIPDEMPLLDRGLGLDSVAILRLVAALEDEFGVEIEEDVLRPELFRSVETLTEYMAARAAGARAVIGD